MSLDLSSFLYQPGFPSVISILSSVMIQDQMLGESRTSNTVLYSNINASLQELTPEAKSEYEAHNIRVSHACWFPNKGQNIKINYIIQDQIGNQFTIEYVKSFVGQSPMIEIICNQINV